MAILVSLAVPTPPRFSTHAFLTYFFQTCSVGEYQGPSVALALAGAVVLVLFYLDKLYGDQAPAAKAAPVAAPAEAAPASPRGRGRPAKVVSEVSENGNGADQASIKREKTEVVSAAGSDDDQFSPYVIFSF